MCNDFVSHRFLTAEENNIYPCLTVTVRVSSSSSGNDELQDGTLLCLIVGEGHFAFFRFFQPQNHSFYDFCPKSVKNLHFPRENHYSLMKMKNDDEKSEDFFYLNWIKFRVIKFCELKNSRNF